jgi:hypothetical protein
MAGWAIVGAILYATVPHETAHWIFLLLAVAWIGDEVRAIRIVLSRTMLGVDHPVDHHPDSKQAAQSP